MSTSRGPSRVIAGFDGSDPARRAVWWAAEEALSQGRSLLIVQALEIPVPGAGGPWGMVDMFADDRLRAYAEQQLTDIADRCRRDAPMLTVDVELRIGHPGTALADVVRDVGAALLVLGPSGHGALPRMLLGSTAAELVRTVRQPVVVVRESDRESGTDGTPAPVVVGVDGTGMSDRAIGVAFDFAERHGRELHAVHAWADRPVDVLSSVGLWKPEPGENVTEEIARTFVDAWAERHPTVVVRMFEVHDRPAHALLERAEGASLLVVGSRGRGAIRGALLGSVSHAVLYHAPCPVAVVPIPEEDQPR